MGGGQPLQSAATTPLEQAQQMVHQALATTGSERAELAKRALEISPDCADAYVLLAEMSRMPEEMRRYYEQGVAAGERALGSQVFAEDVGMFWGLLETRPYMRARLGLAQMLWHVGERQAAIAHARDLLRLNPGDNQGIRYLLATWLTVMGDDTAVAQLLAAYPDEWSAQWAYTRALHIFRTQGRGQQAGEALEQALVVNPFVPMYMLEVLPLPEKQPEYYGMGDKNEAAIYLVGNIDAWTASPGAGEWLVDGVTRIMGPKALQRGHIPAHKRAPAKPRPSTKRSTSGGHAHGPKRK